MSRRLTRVRREHRRREYEERTAEITAALDQGFDDLYRLWSVARPIFAEMTEGETYTRRPSLSVRVPVEGDPFGRLLVAPGWNPTRKEVLPGILVLDMTVERVPPVFASEIAYTFDGTLSRPRRWSIRWGIESARRAFEAIRAFLAEPDRTFARSGTHCGICGRALTDPISRGRGIGPECLDRANRVREAIERFFADHGVAREDEDHMLREARERAKAARAEEAAQRARWAAPAGASTPAEADAEPLLFS